MGTITLKTTSTRVEAIRAARASVSARKASDPRHTPASNPKHTVAPEVMKATRAWVRAQLPDQRPYVIGIRDQLIERAPAECPPEAIAIAMHEITSAAWYLGAFEGATHRHGLDGETVPLDDGSRAFAAGRLFEQKKQEQKRSSHNP